jgi:hypothetical protein
MMRASNLNTRVRSIMSSFPLYACAAARAKDVVGSQRLAALCAKASRVLACFGRQRDGGTRSRPRRAGCPHTSTPLCATESGRLVGAKRFRLL